jgi:UDP-N-acetylglucosamine 2-epimerase
VIVTVVGARPQFVKAAVVSVALAKAGIREALVHTGQHYDDAMSGVFWRELALPGIAENLAVGSGPHGRQTGQMMEKFEAYLATREETRGVLVYGDTNSTLAAALVASKLHLPVFHVEAGLRSFDRTMPEEVNRIVADHLSELLFCPSENAREHLAREGITRGVHVVGDVMYDAFQTFAPRATRDGAHAGWVGEGRPRVLLTLHRPSNTDDPARLVSILDAVANSGASVLWPVHPRVSAIAENLHAASTFQRVAPLSYLDMLGALARADVVVTDSGGLQKEAYWSRVRCITVRRETEWVETLADGWNTLAPEPESVRAALSAPAPTTWTPLYGDGSAAGRIAGAISERIR